MQELQEQWQHAIPASDTAEGRISLTFRQIGAGWVATARETSPEPEVEPMEWENITLGISPRQSAPPRCAASLVFIDMSNRDGNLRVRGAIEPQTIQWLRAQPRHQTDAKTRESLGVNAGVFFPQAAPSRRPR